MTDFIHTTTPYPEKALFHIKNIVDTGDQQKIIEAFAFDDRHPTGYIHFLFDYWARLFFPRYFQSEAPPFHHEIMDYFLSAYMGRPLPGGETNYVNLGFRGCAKTSLTKLMLTYLLLHDLTKKEGSIGRRQYIKVLTRNQNNARQIVTDVYNMMVEVQDLYGNYFVKEDAKKREETMGSFTMTDGRKLLSGTIGMTQRGHLQDSFRPDFILFDDVEDNESIESLAQTEATINRIDEALAGLSADGTFVVNGNYISEEGVIQWFINMKSTYVHKIPIVDDSGEPTWPQRYPKEKIEDLRVDALDFYGDYLCLKPDTPIFTTKGWKFIKDITTEDFVITHKNRPQKVLKTMSNESENLLDITVNGVTTTITKEHPVLTSDGWVPAGELSIGDIVVCKAP